MTDKPKGDGDRRGPGDTERAWAAAAPCKYAALGARLVFGEELPGERLVWCTEDVVSTSAVSAANCDWCAQNPASMSHRLLQLVKTLFTSQHRNSLQNNLPIAALRLILHVVCSNKFLATSSTPQIPQYQNL